MRVTETTGKANPSILIARKLPGHPPELRARAANLPPPPPRRDNQNGEPARQNGRGPSHTRSFLDIATRKATPSNRPGTLSAIPIKSLVGKTAFERSGIILCKSYFNNGLQSRNQAVEGHEKPLDNRSTETTLRFPSRRVTNDAKPGSRPPPGENPMYKGSPHPQKPRMIPTNYKEESEKT